MATSLILLRFTPQGIAQIKESPARVAAAKQAFHALGAEVEERVWATVERLLQEPHHIAAEIARQRTHGR